jgi:transportin-1
LKAKNLLILYDAIGTLGDAVRSELNKPQFINILLPPLIVKWNALADDDRGLLPLLECLTSVASALGVGFQNFAHPVYHRCLKLIEMTLLKDAVFLQLL